MPGLLGASLAAQQACHAKLAESIGRKVPHAAGHFVTPATQRNGVGLGRGYPLIDANAYCVKYQMFVLWTVILVTASF
jgi:hypothetical protein